jgi:glutamine amidotransferase
VIAIVDYGMGNVRSVRDALEYIGEDAEITSDPSRLAAADRLILPGVGAFGDAMANLEARSLPSVLRLEVFEKRKPFLGICLGLQLLAETSCEHGEHRGLGWIDGAVVRFNPENALKVPHMGWNDLEKRTDHPLLGGLEDSQLCFYFVHSYYLSCDDTDAVMATCTYGAPFAAMVARDNIAATQFHPEKSQDSGIQLLKNFARWEP